MSSRSYGEQPVQTEARRRGPQGGYPKKMREKEREREE